MKISPIYRIRILILLMICLPFLTANGSVAFGQTFGTEVGNTSMPASGGMGGVSISKPQDILSALHANPATLTQYPRTHFAFGGGWMEHTYNISHKGNVLPGIGTFSAKSASPGFIVGNIGSPRVLKQSDGSLLSAWRWYRPRTLVLTLPVFQPDVQKQPGTGKVIGID